MMRPPALHWHWDICAHQATYVRLCLPRHDQAGVAKVMQACARYCAWYCPVRRTSMNMRLRQCSVVHKSKCTRASVEELVYKRSARPESVGLGCCAGSAAVSCECVLSNAPAS